MSRKHRHQEKTKEGFILKAILCNIWINLGNENPYTLKSHVLARMVAEALVIELPRHLPKTKAAQTIIAWVRENRPLLAKTSMDRRCLKAGTSVARSSDERDLFYKSWDWRTVRMAVLKERGRRCECCGATPADKDMAGNPVKICVDHIKPLSRYWHLRLDKTNLQILCDECNQGKGAWDETDWRAEESAREGLGNAVKG